MWAKFLEKLKEPMVALLLGSACVSLLTRQYDDAISITLVSVVGSVAQPLPRNQHTRHFAPIALAPSPSCRPSSS